MLIKSFINDEESGRNNEVNIDFGCKWLAKVQANICGDELYKVPRYELWIEISDFFHSSSYWKEVAKEPIVV